MTVLIPHIALMNIRPHPIVINATIGKETKGRRELAHLASI